MFEKAARMKLRFNFKGICDVEDLWDLSLEDLNDIYKTYNENLKQDGLLDKQNEISELRVEIVKHIFNVKKEEMKEAEKQVLKSQKKHRVLKILAEKQDDELKNKSADELMKIIEDM